MEKSFFDFAQPLSDSYDANEEDLDYDALNGETFGEGEPFTDWEENHEKLASELEGRNFDDANNELSEQMAKYILDDEGEEVFPANTKPPASGPNLDWWEKSEGKKLEKYRRTSTPIDKWRGRETSSIPDGVMTSRNEMQNIPIIPPKILTVVELENQMREHAEYTNKEMHSLASASYSDQHKPMNQGQMSYTRNEHHIDPRASGNRYHQDQGHDSYHPQYLVPYDMGPPLRNHGPRPLRGMPRPPGPRGHQRPQGPMNQRNFTDQRHHPRFRRGLFPQGPMNHQNELFPPYLPLGPQQIGYNKPGPPVDEYAGLMRPQEKQWLCSIQLMQLNTNQPLQDDYYFLMHQNRHLGNTGRRLANMNFRNIRDVPIPRPAPTYAPLQFENSLGKLQIGSVTAPRKIIDMDSVDLSAHYMNFNHFQNKSKQNLLQIEEYFKEVMDIEESVEDIDTIPAQGKLLTSIMAGDKLATVMSVRKGKKMVLRMLPILFDHTPLINKMLQDLVPIARKDNDQILLSFLPAIRTCLATVSLEVLVMFTSQYDTKFLLSNKFMISVMANMVERAEQVADECEDLSVVRDWKLTLMRLAASTEHWAEQERPVVAVDRSVLLQHLTRITESADANQVNALVRALSSLRSITPPPQDPSG